MESRAQYGGQASGGDLQPRETDIIAEFYNVGSPAHVGDTLTIYESGGQRSYTITGVLQAGGKTVYWMRPL